MSARLGVFVGGCTLEAAEDVCNADHDLPVEVLDGLAALVDKSLLKQAGAAAPRGELEPRFTMLETIREYALERLVTSGEAEALRRRHATYFLALAEMAEPQLSGRNQVAWSARLEQEHDNLRAVSSDTIYRNPYCLTGESYSGESVASPKIGSSATTVLGRTSIASQRDLGR